MNNFDPTIVAGEDVALGQGSGDATSLLGTRTTNSSARHRLPFILNALKLADVAALVIASFGGYFMRFGLDSNLSPTDRLFIYLSILVTIVSLHVSQAYRIRSLPSLYPQLSTLFVGATGALSFILVCSYLSGTLSAHSRVWFVYSACTSFALLLINRVVVTRVVYRARQADMLTESIVLVGANERSELVIDSIRATAHSNIKILGVFDDRVMRDMPARLRPEVLGSTSMLLDYIRRNHVDRVVVALPWVATDRINDLLKKLRTVPVRIDLVPNNVVWQFPSIKLERLASVPVLTVANSRVDEQMGLIKRIEDLVISSILLTLISPLLLLIALVIKLDSLVQ